MQGYAKDQHTLVFWRWNLGGVDGVRSGWKKIRFALSSYLLHRGPGGGTPDTPLLVENPNLDELSLWEKFCCVSNSLGSTGEDYP